MKAYPHIYKVHANTHTTHIQSTCQHTYMNTYNMLTHLHVRKHAHTQNNFIRTYFSQLTHSFLIPLEQYITRLMPLKKDILATKPVPKLPDFHARNFLLSLQASLPQLQRLRKGNWAGLYGCVTELCWIGCVNWCALLLLVCVLVCAASACVCVCVCCRCYSVHQHQHLTTKRLQPVKIVLRNDGVAQKKKSMRLWE